MNYYGMETTANSVAFKGGYFYHDTQMRKDSRLLALRRKFKLTGMAVWYMLLENLDRKDMQWIICFDRVARECLAADFGIKEERLVEIVEYCVRLRLLEVDGNWLVVRYSGFWGFKSTTNYGDLSKFRDVVRDYDGYGMEIDGYGRPIYDDEDDEEEDDDDDSNDEVGGGGDEAEATFDGEATIDVGADMDSEYCSQTDERPGYGTSDSFMPQDAHTDDVGRSRAAVGGV